MKDAHVHAQVVSKVMKHAYESPSATAHGLLLGLDLDGTLEVSNSFPLPYHSHDDDDKSTKAIGMFLCSLCSCESDVD